jgi:hypothetical protein
VEDAETLDPEFGLWQAQTRFFEIWRAQPAARPVLAPLATALGFNLDAGAA